jgi:hypothetical protein
MLIEKKKKPPFYAQLHCQQPTLDLSHSKNKVTLYFSAFLQAH